jgi:uncharacterized membrane protein HdeD (DUF308 family)
MNGTINGKLRLFLARGLVAIVWAVVFAAAADSLTTGVGVLLVLYPLIDAFASVIDARGQRGSERQLLEINTGISVVAAVALGIAAGGDKGDALAVFGVWALVTGGMQLAVTIRRRPTLGHQLAAAVGRRRIDDLRHRLPYMSGADDPKLRAIAFYAAGGGIEFAIQAWLLTRRPHRAAPAT